MRTSTTEVGGASRLRRPRIVRRHPWASGGVLLALVAVVIFVVVYFDPQAIFINHTVDEPLPAGAAMTSATPSPGSGGGSIRPQSPAAGGPATVARGEFRSLEHHTTGTALVLRLADGSTVVRLEGLDTSNGPDVHLTLSPTPSTAGNSDYGDYLDLGSLKGNRGNQNYTVPAGTDLSRFRSVVIWCKRFSVGFGVAPIA